jgi:nucleotide-binding universal stress UspA family protein
VVETGDEATYLAEHGRVADLIVAGRPREGETVAFDVLEVSLLHTGRPVLIVPAVLPAQRSGTVVIAWKNKPEAARAVAAAQPLVAAAKKVIILAVEEGSGTAEPSCKRLRAALLWHNPNTSIERLTQDSRPCAEVVLDAAMAAEADVLVMGGYGHSRVREVIFGGVTEHVLAGAAVPVFMVH